jgi:acyl carrier protein
VQVGRGYLKLPALTDERFIDDFFSKENGRKLYKSGDLARWLPDGNIEYLGRIDDQVKIRGYRIELGEIESVLQQSGLVNQSVVLAKEDAKGNKRLIGYVVSNDPFNQEEINQYLFQKLPDYMVPALWVQLESLPLTSNGKIDRKALPDPRVSGDGNQEYMAPRDETEQRLVEIWQELLGLEKVGIHDNFFKLGGHSILVMQVISSLRKKFKLEVSIKDFFANPTIAALAENILSTGSENFGQTEIKVVDPRPEIIPLSFNQERLWFIHQLEGSVEYHIPVILQLNGVLNPHALNYAVQNIVNRHEVLRTVYKEYKGQGYQHVLPKDGFRLQFENDLVFGSNTEKLQHHVRKLIKSPFDLSTDHMIRGTVLQLDENKHLLVVTLHHIASDGWSLSIIVKEVAELYDAYVVGRLPSLNALPIQYADFAIWQRDSLQEEVLEKKLNYWKVKLDNTAPLQLPTDYLRPNILSTKGGIVQFEIDKELTDRLRVLSHQQETTLFMTLLAAYKVLLHRHSGQEDICVGTAIAGRQKHEVESLIGFFINSLALRSELNAKDSFSDLLSKVRATTLEAYAHQEVPFEKVVDAVVKERDSSRSPLFQAVFLLQNVPDVPEVKFAGLELSGYDFKGNTAKSELIFQAIETGTGLKCAAQYATDIYGKITIEQLVDRYKELLYSIVKSPEQKIGSLSMSKTFGEPGKLSTTPVSAGAEFLWDKTMVDLFEEQVAKTPNAVALIFDDTKLSYQVLNEAVNKLAHYLITREWRKKPSFLSAWIGRWNSLSAFLEFLKQVQLMFQ